MSGYRVRLVWDLPVTPETYQELGFLVHQLSMITGRMVKELADGEGLVFEVEPPVAAPGVPMDEDEWLDLLEELASKARRVKIIVERDGVPVLSSGDAARARLCGEYLEAGGGGR
ncbi:hypothetical protein Pyrfu_0357 [Pyrolobus fumarii 1A]|uniref:Uncharacterized protein n=1 Tax=Pyrolobus fumarii (strain DSM 11204 / 1A) TaxID=694429 RepID=G0EFQ8_PYRF1|nr:hypothetical protein [Pyrolobus fumarii]AEM38229.1 hypothetical protein Pyrfu_0357 [Pyrolobus fumarii 1A]